jgi:hypothetical protein
VQPNAAAGVSPAALSAAVTNNQAAISNAIATASGSQVLDVSSTDAEVLDECSTMCKTEDPACDFQCADGKVCSSNSDCISDLCSGGHCASPAAASFGAVLSWTTLLAIAVSGLVGMLSVV